MQNVTEAASDSLVQSLDYKLGSSNVNYIQSRKTTFRAGRTSSTSQALSVPSLPPPPESLASP